MESEGDQCKTSKGNDKRKFQKRLLCEKQEEVESENRIHFCQ